MSQPNADWSPQDRAAAAAVVNHHTQLADALNRHTEALLALAESGHRPEAEQVRRQLLDYLHSELMPHAHAEEEKLYPAAADQPGGKLLVDGMLIEHRGILALIDELESAPSPVRAAAVARALAAVFGVHLAKENDLIVPLVAGSPDASLADLLKGMHDLLGAEAHGRPESEHAGDRG